MTAFPAAGDTTGVQAPSLCFSVPSSRPPSSSETASGDAGRGSSAVVFQAAVQAGPRPCAATSGKTLQPGPVQRAGRLPGRSRPEPVRVRHTWLDGAITVNRRLAGADMDWIDGRTLNEYVDFLVAGPTLPPCPRWRVGGASWSRAPADEFAHGTCQHGKRHGGPGRAAPPGRLRRGLDSAAGRASPRPASTATRTTSTPCTTRGTAGSTPSPPWLSTCRWSRWPGSRALAGPVQLQNLLFARPTSSPRSRPRPEAAGCAADSQVRRAGQEAAGVRKPALGVQPEPGGDLEQPPRPRPCRQYRPASPGGSSAPRPPRGPGQGFPPRRRRSRPGRRRPRRQARGSRQRQDQHPHPPRRPRGSAGAALPARPAVRAARHGRYRTDAAAEPDDDAAQRHDLVDRPPAGQARVRRPAPGSARSRISRFRLPGLRAVRAMPRGYAPHAPVPTPPGPPMPGPGAPATARRRVRRGEVALALRRLLLVIGAASHISVVVIGGLVAGAWGIWRLVTRTGRAGRPPGLTLIQVSFFSTTAALRGWSDQHGHAILLIVAGDDDRGVLCWLYLGDGARHERRLLLEVRLAFDEEVVKSLRSCTSRALWKLLSLSTC